MNWLDVVLGLILVASVVDAFRRGFTREIIELVAVVLGFVLGLWFYGWAGSFLEPHLKSPQVAHFAGFLLVFCGVLLVGALVGFVVGKFLKVTGLSFFDHLLGAGFGALRAALISVVLVSGLMAFSRGDAPPAAVANSRLAPYLVGTANLAADMAPHEFKEGFRKAYGQVKQAWANARRRATTPEANRDKK
ncbi:MAG: CvpA family protein [Bryobacteraceae bacterium]|jgi:membrane protein required for colicin V production